MVCCSPLEVGRIEADGAAGNQRRNVDRVLDRHGAAVVFCGRVAGDAEGERVAEILVGDVDRAVDLRDVLRVAVASDLGNTKPGW